MGGNERASRYAASLQSGPGNKLKQLLASFDPSPMAVALLEKTLAFNPVNRITAADCLEHMYLAEVRMRCTQMKARYASMLWAHATFAKKSDFVAPYRYEIRDPSWRQSPLLTCRISPTLREATLPLRRSRRRSIPRLGSSVQPTLHRDLVVAFPAHLTRRGQVDLNRVERLQQCMSSVVSVKLRVIPGSRWTTPHRRRLVNVHATTS